MHTSHFYTIYFLTNGIKFSIAEIMRLIKYVAAVVITIRYITRVCGKMPDFIRQSRTAR